YGCCGGQNREDRGAKDHVKIARFARPNASLQNVPEECIISTTSFTACTNSSASRSFTTRGGAALSTIKLFPHICVRKPWRNSRITTTCPNMPGWILLKASKETRNANFRGAW